MSGIQTRGEHACFGGRVGFCTHASKETGRAMRVAVFTPPQALRLRRHEGYDHSYWFIRTFIADHLAHHARQPIEAR